MRRDGDVLTGAGRRAAGAVVSGTFTDQNDSVGLANDGPVVAGECKYTTREMHEGDLADLERSARQIQWTPPSGGTPEYHYCCFGRSEFSDGLREAARKRDGVSLFTPAEIVTASARP